MVHSTYLIDMQFPGSEKLTFIPDENYDLMIDDLLVFAYQARKAGECWVRAQSSVGCVLSCLVGSMY